MALKFYLLKVKEVIDETPDAISVVFEIPQDLKSTFDYKHGQYITIKYPLKGKDNRRAYSISSSPVKEKGTIRIAIKRVEDGLVSRHINENLKVGDLLEVMPPMGNFTIDVDPSNEKTYMMIGGGSGITPLMSIMETILEVEPKSKITLWYANRFENSIIYEKQIEGFIERFPGRFDVYHILTRPGEGWKGMAGRIERDNCASFVNEKLGDKVRETEYFLCGPGGMMQESEYALEKLGVKKENIHKENFTAPLPKIVDEAEPAGRPKEEEQEIITRNVKIVLYGEELEMEVEPDETVLTAAQREGFDPPFSCQIGACTTCRAKLVSGRVVMDERDALTDDEIEDGYVLTCQSHPASDNVVIDYDDQ